MLLLISNQKFILLLSKDISFLPVQLISILLTPYFPVAADRGFLYKVVGKLLRVNQGRCEQR